MAGALKRMFFGDVPLAVARSLRDEPGRWHTDESRAPYLSRVFELEHEAGVTVWVANGAYGMKVKARGCRTWGGLTGLSTFGLSPGHWLLRIAADRWLARYGGGIRAIPTVLMGGKGAADLEAVAGRLA